MKEDEKLYLLVIIINLYDNINRQSPRFMNDAYHTQQMLMQPTEVSAQLEGFRQAVFNKEKKCLCEILDETEEAIEKRFTMRIQQLTATPL